MAKESTPRITWKIEEYPHKEKGPDWFWALGVIALAGAALAIIYHDALFAILIILSAIILGYYAAREPDIIDIAIMSDGIRIKNYLYPFERLKGFAIEETVGGSTLLIESDRTLTPLISIHVPPTLDTDALAALLRTRIEEKPLTEHVSHKILEHLGF